VPTLDVKVLVVKQGAKHCAFAGTYQNDEDFNTGEEGVEGSYHCAPTRSVAIAKALKGLAATLIGTKPFGRHARRRKR
jgi:hypothetical protein